MSYSIPYLISLNLNLIKFVHLVKNVFALNIFMKVYRVHVYYE